MKVKSLAVLSMAAVGFLIGCNGKEADKQFIDNINKALSTEEKAAVTTPSSAVNKIKEKGYDINGYTLKNSNYKIAYDIDTKQFTLMSGDTLSYSPKGYKLNSNTYHIFKFTNTYDNRSVYSQYLTRDFAGSDLLVATTGVDMGENNNVKNIIYFNSTGTSKDILLNVSCDYLNISTSNDNIYHYGSSNNVFIPSTLTGNYHEYGSCCYIQASGGHVYLESGSYSDVFEVPTGCSVTIDQSQDSDILLEVNAEIRAQSKANVCEISDSSITTANQLQTLLDQTQYNFFRLTTEARDIKVTGTIEFKRNLFFDLNGRSITFDLGSSKTYDNEEYFPAIRVHSETGTESVSAFLMDTQSTSYQRSGINLLDSSIVVEGNTSSNPVNFYMNSGKVHDIKCTANVDKPRSKAAVLVLGNIADTATRDAKHCAFNMYGGFIKTEWGTNRDTLYNGYAFHKQISSKCIQPRGKGSIVNMIYGDLDSFHYCISGQGRCYTTNPIDKDGETEINITGGYLTGGKEQGYDEQHQYTEQGLVYTTLFFPQSGTVNISGANFTGPTCLNAKAGKISITGGVFNATKDPYDEDKHAGNSGSTADGSVIFMESNGYYSGAYISPLEIEVKYATMTSKTGYIIKNSGFKHNENYCKSKITFEGGQYKYKKDKFTTELPEEYKQYFECSITGGTWSQQA